MKFPFYSSFDFYCWHFKLSYLQLVLSHVLKILVIKLRVY